MNDIYPSNSLYFVGETDEEKATRERHAKVLEEVRVDITNALKLPEDLLEPIEVAHKLVAFRINESSDEQERINPKDYMFIPFHYLHGELESLSGFDSLHIRVDDNTKFVLDYIKGNIVDLPVYVKNIKEVVQCTIFSWKLSNNSHKGLVVKKGDIESYNYAKSKFDEKAEFI